MTAERHATTLPDEVWGLDFFSNQTTDGRTLKWLAVIDEPTRELSPSTSTDTSVPTTSHALSTGSTRHTPPWQNAHTKSFSGTLRDELLNTELFHTLAEAQLLADLYRYDYNHHRPHSSTGGMPPVLAARAHAPDQTTPQLS